MLLALDLGNSSLSAGVFDGGKVVHKFRVFVAEFDKLTEQVSERLAWVSPPNIDRIAIASVNPPRLYPVVESLHSVLPALTPVVLGRDLRVPISTLVDHPEEVGVDRLLNGLAAFRRSGDGCVVVDFGSAITLDVVSRRGEFLGGVIAPGITMFTGVLHERTALLPEVKIEPVERVIGKNTVSCIRSGVYWGIIAMIEGLVERIKREYAGAMKVYATGGDAEFFAEHCRVIDEVVPELTLEGIYLTVAQEARV
jgi:type III pantothenate kinase